MVVQRTSRDSRGCGSIGALSQGETLALALLLQRASALDALLLVLELQALALELFLHLSVASIELLFRLLQLALLLRHLLLEDHLHLGLHLGELLLVQGTLLLLLDSRVDLLENTGVLRHAHGDELVGTVVLVEHVVRVLLELFHVCADKHLAQLDKVAMLLVINLDGAPRVLTATDSTSIGSLDLVGGTDDGEWHLGHDLVVLSDRLLVIQLVSRTLENLNTMVLDIGQDLIVYVSYSTVPVNRRCTHSGLEVCNLLIGERIRLGNDGDQVDLGVEAAHNLDVEGLEGVAGRLDKENTGMNSVINNVHSVDLVLGIEVGIVTLLNVFDDRAPGLVVVDEVTEAGGIDNGQAQTNASLLNIGTDRLDSDSLGNDVKTGSLALLGGVQRGVEKRVNKRRLAQTGFTYGELDHDTHKKPRGKNLPTTMTLKLKPLRTLLRCHWLGRLAKPT